jgi:DNA repair photolyase
MVSRLRDAGIPVGVLVAPIIPALTDHELEAILGAARAAGAGFAGYTVLRLPGEVAGLFEDWLQRHRPERAARVLNALRELWGERLSSSTFGHRQRGAGDYATLLGQRFDVACRRLGLGEAPTLDVHAFRPPAGGQLGLGF